MQIRLVALCNNFLELLIVIFIDWLVLTAATTAGTINTIECNIGKFDCGPSATGQRCISYTWVCDGEDDCSNGADEAMCSMYIITLL